MLELYKNIKEKRIENKLTQSELAEKLGYADKSMIAKIEAGKVDLSQSKIVAFSEALGVSAGELMGMTQYENSLKTETQGHKITRISLPILGSENQTGSFIFADNATVDFAFIIKDQSMVMARLLEGDVVFINSNKTIINGRIYAIELNHEITLKRLFLDKVNNILQLISENPSYEPLIYTGQGLNEIKIIGQAVAFQSNFR